MPDTLEERINMLIKKHCFFRVESKWLSVRTYASLGRLLSLLRVGTKHKSEFGFKVAGFNMRMFFSAELYENFLNRLQSITFLDETDGKLVRVSFKIDAPSIASKTHVEELLSEFSDIRRGGYFFNENTFSSFSIGPGNDKTRGKYFINLENREIKKHFIYDSESGSIVGEDPSKEFILEKSFKPHQIGFFLTDIPFDPGKKIKNTPLNRILMAVNLFPVLEKYAKKFIQNSILLSDANQILNCDFEKMPFWPLSFSQRIENGIKKGNFIRIKDTVVNVRALSSSYPLTRIELTEKGIKIVSKREIKGEVNPRYTFIGISRSELIEILEAHYKKFRRKEVQELLLIALIN